MCGSFLSGGCYLEFARVEGRVLEPVVHFNCNRNGSSIQSGRVEQDAPSA